jgi:hypothetical protein
MADLDDLAAATAAFGDLVGKFATEDGPNDADFAALDVIMARILPEAPPPLRPAVRRGAPPMRPPPRLAWVAVGLSVTDGHGRARLDAWASFYGLEFSPDPDGGDGLWAPLPETTGIKGQADTMDLLNSLGRLQAGGNE